MNGADCPYKFNEEEGTKLDVASNEIIYDTYDKDECGERKFATKIGG